MSGAKVGAVVATNTERLLSRSRAFLRAIVNLENDEPVPVLWVAVAKGLLRDIDQETSGLS